jgi:hypothetical protein
MDLSGLGGGLVSVGGYLIAAGDRAQPRAALGCGALGSVAGLAIGYWLTDSMDEDPGQSAPETVASRLTHLTPMLQPVPGGFIAGVGSRL